MKCIKDGTVLKKNANKERDILFKSMLIRAASKKLREIHDAFHYK